MHHCLRKVLLSLNKNKSYCHFYSFVSKDKILKWQFFNSYMWKMKSNLIHNIINHLIPVNFCRNMVRMSEHMLFLSNLYPVCDMPDYITDRSPRADHFGGKTNGNTLRLCSYRCWARWHYRSCSFYCKNFPIEMLVPVIGEVSFLIGLQQNIFTTCFRTLRNLRNVVIIIFGNAVDCWLQGWIIFMMIKT